MIDYSINNFLKMPLRRSSNKRNLHGLKLWYRNPARIKETKDEKKNNKYGTLVIFALVLAILLI